MDDYGRPLDLQQPEPRDDEGARYNVGVISEWHELDTDHGAMMALARPGDLLEFQREGYCHWAVYIGDHARMLEVLTLNLSNSKYGSFSIVFIHSMFMNRIQTKMMMTALWSLVLFTEPILQTVRICRTCSGEQ